MLARFEIGLRRVHRGILTRPIGCYGLSMTTATTTTTTTTAASTHPSQWKPLTDRLLERTKDFDARSDRFGGVSHSGKLQAEYHNLLNDWRHVLFKIPNNETEILSKSANSIEKLLHSIFDRISRKNEGTQCFDHKSNSQSFQKNHYFQPPPTLRDDVTTGIYAWGRTAVNDSSSPLRAEALFQKFEKNCKISRSSNSICRPTSDVYSALVYCWSQAQANQIASQKALYWFRKIEENKAMVVTSEAWNALLRIHVRQGKNVDKNLLTKHSILNDGYTYASLVEGWMDSELPYSSKNAYNELQRGIAYCIDKEDQMPALRQLILTYLVKNIEKGNILEYEQVMNQASILQENRPELDFFDAKHFLAVMNAFGARGDSDKVIQLYQELQIDYEQGSERFKPSYQIVVAVLSALAKKQNLKSLAACESLLSEIESYLLIDGVSAAGITNHAYNIVLDCYIRFPHVKNRRQRVEKLIERMEKLASKHNNPLLRPDKLSFAAYIKSIMQEDKPGSVLEIDKILQRMENSHLLSIQPDRNIYTIVLEAVLARGEKTAILQAKDVMDRMGRCVNLLPDRIMYTILMKIHSLVGDVQGSDDVLNEMIEAYEKGRADCCPNEKAFVTAISSLKQLNREDVPDEAFRIFNKMVALYNNGIEECRPSMKTFGMLMVILAKSNHKSKLQMAQRLIYEMEKYGVNPDLTLLNWYMRVCTTITSSDLRQHRESWTEILLTFNTLQERGIANSHSYNSVFHACDRFVLDPDERYSFFRDTYYKCRKDGQVDRKILTSLRRFLSPKVYRHLTKLDPSDNTIKMKVYRQLNRLDPDDNDKM